MSFKLNQILKRSANNLCRGRSFIFIRTITAVNQQFLDNKQLKVLLLGRGFTWLDIGTHDSLSKISTFVEVIEKRQGLKIACLEGIVLRHSWIAVDKIRELASVRYTL